MPEGRNKTGPEAREEQRDKNKLGLLLGGAAHDFCKCSLQAFSPLTPRRVRGAPGVLITLCLQMRHFLSSHTSQAVL